MRRKVSLLVLIAWFIVVTISILLTVAIMDPTPKNIILFTGAWIILTLSSCVLVYLNR